ncbi:MAG TPA: 2-hydroxychromene-2-carboxylate isomerase [Burkholderiaceae bacterium]|nr:2-hydroxychromene-2-carboxylate isomerase [Burkholderiaceae bacterium]
MASPIEFFFDFSSPYSYLASEQIESLAARFGRSVDFRPTLLGAVFRVSGQRPLTEIPLKGDYSRLDFARSARFASVPFQMPEPFPVATVQAARACLVLEQERPDLKVPFVHATFRAYFVQGQNIAQTQVLHQVLEQCGANAHAVLEATERPQIKDLLKAEVDASVARGVFGAPFIFVDGEPFWGNDRLPQIERWLASGPF